MQFSLKKSYSEKKEEAYFNGAHKNRREADGIKEVQTIVLMAKYFFPNSILSNHEEKGLNSKSVRLLDIGCGDRYVSYGCSHHNFEYDGIDYNECNVEFESISREDDSFDVVIALALVEHLRDPSNLISEAYRLLKKGGLLILSTPNWKYCVKDFYDDPTHIHPYTPKSLKELLEVSLFSSVRIVPNLRSQNKAAYIGELAFFRAARLRFFPNSKKYLWLPKFLRGKARGIFGISMK